MSHLPRQHGFSLLELLLVLGLMATAAVLALSAVSNDDNQRRFEETRSKLERLRVGIVGEPLEIYGQRSLNGFVTDMGRLPNNLNELLSPTDCDPDTVGDQACPVWDFDEDNELWSGWHGPYINTIDLDFRDGWGKDWNWEDTTTDTQPGTLTIASFGLDTDGDIDVNSMVGVDAAFGNPDLQKYSINSLSYSVELPSSPFRLIVEKAPFCGLCRDIESTHQTDTDCTNAGNSWDDDLNYCIESSSTSASSCDAVTEKTSWTPIFGRCHDGSEITYYNYNNKNECEAAAYTWEELDDAGSCPATYYNFTENEPDLCTRIIHANDGLINASTNSSSDATMISIEQSSIGEETFPYEPVMEDTDDPGTPSLVLPQGSMRVGLYIYDTATNTCTEDPYPSIRGQARSDVITLYSDYPHSIGTSSNPITLHWRSR